MSSYCASCLADLALVRDAVTSVNGTAACVAHAVLLTHPTDSPQRRLFRDFVSLSPLLAAPLIAILQ